MHDFRTLKINFVQKTDFMVFFIWKNHQNISTKQTEPNKNDQTKKAKQNRPNKIKKTKLEPIKIKFNETIKNKDSK